MASTFTTLGIEKMATGENAGTWGDKTNTNLDIVNTAVSGYVEQAVTSGGTTALSILDGAATSTAQNAVIKLTGTISGNSIVTVPDSVEKVYIVTNGTSGAYTVQFKTASGSGITFGLSEKTTKLLYSDGTNIVDAGFSGGTDLDGKELILDADGDTSITADTDDQIDIKIAGTDQLTIKDGALSPVTNNDIDLGTASLEFKNAFFDGTVTSDAFAGPLTGNVTGNVSGTAATVTTAAQSNITSLGTLTTLTIDNVIINGSTIGHTGDTDLITVASGIATVAGEVSMTTLDIGGTNVTATATEINLIDGGATVGTTAIADGDGLIINDGGTMRVSTVQTLSAYLDDEITAMPNLITTAATTVGALDSGSITSGFGTIDTGASAITTTGLISGGSLDIDNVLINGTTIGHTDDTDLITLADGIATVAGEISVTTLDIGGTNVTSTATELNLLDGVSGLVQADLTKLAALDATAAEINLIDGGTSTGTTAVADADGIITNDGGTMRLTTAATFKTYFQDGVTASSIAADDIGAGDAAVSLATSSGNITVDSNAGAVSIDGHTGVTLASSSSGDITLDSIADINFDANGNDFLFKANGTHILSIVNSSSDVIIKPIVDAKDLIFQQRDGTEVARIEDNGTFNIVTDKLAINGTAVTSTAAELNKVDGVGTLKQAGKETIWIPSNAMTGTTTNGAERATVETTSGRPDMQVLDFDKDSDEFAQFAVAFPKSYNLGTVTFQFFWSGIAATTGVEMTLAGVAMNDNETIDVAYGTAVAVADAAQGAVEELLVSAESGAITIAGTMADNDLCYFRIGRDVSEDDMAGDCRLHGIKLHFTTDAANDA